MVQFGTNSRFIPFHPAGEFTPTEIIIHYANNYDTHNNVPLPPEKWTTDSIWNGLTSREVSSHFGVGSDGQITQFLPMYENRVSASWGAAGHEKTAVNIEMGGNKDYFSRLDVPEAETDRTIDLVIKLMIQYNIPFDKVIGHYETNIVNGQVVNAKSDPTPEYMAFFRQKLAARLNELGYDFGQNKQAEQQPLGSLVLPLLGPVGMAVGARREIELFLNEAGVNQGRGMTSAKPKLFQLAKGFIAQKRAEWRRESLSIKTNNHFVTTLTGAARTRRIAEHGPFKDVFVEGIRFWWQAVWDFRKVLEAARQTQAPTPVHTAQPTPILSIAQKIGAAVGGGIVRFANAIVPEKWKLKLAFLGAMPLDQSGLPLNTGANPSDSDLPKLPHDVAQDLAEQFLSEISDAVKVPGETPEAFAPSWERARRTLEQFFILKQAAYGTDQAPSEWQAIESKIRIQWFHVNERLLSLLLSSLRTLERSLPSDYDISQGNVSILFAQVVDLQEKLFVLETTRRDFLETEGARRAFREIPPALSVYHERTLPQLSAEAAAIQQRIADVAQRLIPSSGQDILNASEYVGADEFKQRVLALTQNIEETLNSLDQLDSSVPLSRLPSWVREKKETLMRIRDDILPLIDVTNPLFGEKVTVRGIERDGEYEVRVLKQLGRGYLSNTYLVRVIYSSDPKLKGGMYALKVTTDPKENVRMVSENEFLLKQQETYPAIHDVPRVFSRVDDLEVYRQLPQITGRKVLLMELVEFPTVFDSTQYRNQDGENQKRFIAQVSQQLVELARRIGRGRLTLDRKIDDIRVRPDGSILVLDWNVSADFGEMGESMDVQKITSFLNEFLQRGYIDSGKRPFLSQLGLHGDIPRDVFVRAGELTPEFASFREKYIQTFGKLGEVVMDQKMGKIRTYDDLEKRLAEAASSLQAEKPVSQVSAITPLEAAAKEIIERNTNCGGATYQFVPQTKTPLVRGLLGKGDAKSPPPDKSVDSIPHVAGGSEFPFVTEHASIVSEVLGRVPSDAFQRVDQTLASTFVGDGLSTNIVSPQDSFATPAKLSIPSFSLIPRVYAADGVPAGKSCAWWARAVGPQGRQWARAYVWQMPNRFLWQQAQQFVASHPVWQTPQPIQFLAVAHVVKIQASQKSFFEVLRNVFNSVESLLYKWKEKIPVPLSTRLRIPQSTAQALIDDFEMRGGESYLGQVAPERIIKRSGEAYVYRYTFQGIEYAIKVSQTLKYKDIFIKTHLKNQHILQVHGFSNFAPVVMIQGNRETYLVQRWVDGREMALSEDSAILKMFRDKGIKISDGLFANIVVSNYGPVLIDFGKLVELPDWQSSRKKFPSLDLLSSFQNDLRESHSIKMFRFVEGNLKPFLANQNVGIVEAAQKAIDVLEAAAEEKFCGGGTSFHLIPQVYAAGGSGGTNECQLVVRSIAGIAKEAMEPPIYTPLRWFGILPPLGGPPPDEKKKEKDYYQKAMLGLSLLLLAHADGQCIGTELWENVVRTAVAASIPILNTIHQSYVRPVPPSYQNPLPGNPDYRPYLDILRDGIRQYQQLHPGVPVRWYRSKDYITLDMFNAELSRPITQKECETYTVFCADFIDKSPFDAVWIEIGKTGPYRGGISFYHNPVVKIFWNRIQSIGYGAAVHALSVSKTWNLFITDIYPFPQKYVEYVDAIRQKVETLVNQRHKPVSASELLSWFLEARDGDLVLSLEDLSDFLKIQARLCSDTECDNNARWMQTYIKDEYSLDIPYTHLPVPDPMTPEGTVDYDFSGRNRVGEPYHAANLVALLSYVPPELISAASIAHKLDFFSVQGMGKILVDLNVSNDLYAIDDFFAKYDTSRTVMQRTCRVPTPSTK